MTWDPGKFCKLVLDRTPGKQGKFLYCLRTTAAFYGWDQAFPAWTPPTVYTDDRYEYSRVPLSGSHLGHQGGRRHFICRSESRQGQPAGKTNAFRVSRNCGLVDIAELAHFATGPWCWISCQYGGRRSREEWEEIYLHGPSASRRIYRPSRPASTEPAR